VLALRRWDLVVCAGALAWAGARACGGCAARVSAGARRQWDAVQLLALLALVLWAWESELRWAGATYAVCVHPAGRAVCGRVDNWARGVRTAAADVPRDAHPFVKVL
jgi:hypothetical protein